MKTYPIRKAIFYLFFVLLSILSSAHLPVEGTKTAPNTLEWHISPSDPGCGKAFLKDLNDNPKFAAWFNQLSDQSARDKVVEAWEVAFDAPSLRVNTDWLSRTDNWIRDGVDQAQIKKLLSETELSPQLRHAFELDEINFNSWNRIDRGSPSFRTTNFSGYLATLKKMTRYDNTASSTDVVKYYRVQGGGSGSATSRELLTVEPNGNLTFNDKSRELYFSTDDMDHAIYYTTGQGINILGNTLNVSPPRPDGVIIEFEVPKWLDNQMKSEAIPQHRAGSNPLNNNSPQIVDPTQPGNPFGIKESWQTLIESNYIEGSARIVE